MVGGGNRERKYKDRHNGGTKRPTVSGLKGKQGDHLQGKGRAVE